MTTLTKILVRDTYKQADTGIVFTDGCTLFLSQLPAHWTLDFVTTHTDKIYFWLDNGPMFLLEATPYCPLGHNNPLNLAVGPHTVKIAIATLDNPTTYNFTVATAPVVIPPPAATMPYGTNSAGVDDSANDIILHPPVLSAMKTFGFTIFRPWQDWGFGKQWPSTASKIPLELRAQEIRTWLQMNFQQCPGNRIPTDAEALATANSAPTSAASGIDCIIHGNEIDTTAYYTGTPAQYVHYLQLVCPIYKAKGYKNILGSSLLSFNYLRELQKLGAFSLVDMIDYHFYPGSAKDGATLISLYYAFCELAGKIGVVSECNIRQGGMQIAAWAEQQKEFFAEMLNSGIEWLHFCLFALGGSDPLANVDALMTAKYENNEPFWSAVKAGLGK